MSSDIFSRRMDFSKFALIYAGTQKNMGAAGATMVVVKENILGSKRTEDYRGLKKSTVRNKGSCILKLTVTHYLQELL
jgi:phosphoserine aminotransferase